MDAPQTDAAVGDPVGTTPPPRLFRLARTLHRRRLRGARWLMRRLEDRGALDRVARYPGRPRRRARRAAVPRGDALGRGRRGRLRDRPDRRPRADRRRLAAAAGARRLRRRHRHGVRPHRRGSARPAARDLRRRAQSWRRSACSRPTWSPARARPIVRHAAVADFAGRGRMDSPDWDPSDHARYLVPADDGDVDVLRVDDLPVEPGAPVVLKIDVEGGELAVLRGARETPAPRAAVDGRLRGPPARRRAHADRAGRHPRPRPCDRRLRRARERVPGARDRRGPPAVRPDRRPPGHRLQRRLPVPRGGVSVPRENTLHNFAQAADVLSRSPSQEPVRCPPCCARASSPTGGTRCPTIQPTSSPPRTA